VKFHTNNGTLIGNPTQEVKHTSENGCIASISGWNSNEATSSTTLKAFTRWLHYWYAPVELPLVEGILFSHTELFTTMFIMTTLLTGLTRVSEWTITVTSFLPCCSLLSPVAMALTSRWRLSAHLTSTWIGFCGPPTANTSTLTSRK